MPVSYRPAVPSDTPAIFSVFYEAIVELNRRLGFYEDRQPSPLEEVWPRHRELFEHLEATAEHVWLAEESGELLGYARTILRGPLRELTELFVRPAAQAGGIGGELLRRAFDREGAQRRAVIASPYTPAQVRYLKAGMQHRFPIAYFYPEQPAPAEAESDLEFVAFDQAPRAQAAVDRIDRAVLGHTRPVDHAYLRSNRACFLARRGGRTVGYHYAGKHSGPFALLDPADMPAALAHAATHVAASDGEFTLPTPMVNSVAVDWLLAHGFRMDPHYAHFLSDTPFGRFDRYIFCEPTFFM